MNELKKLRKKFILLATAALLLLLVIIMVTSSLLTYQDMKKSADDVIDAILADDGRMEERPEQIRDGLDGQLNGKLKDKTGRFEKDDTNMSLDDGPNNRENTGLAITSDSVITSDSELATKERTLEGQAQEKPETGRILRQKQDVMNDGRGKMVGYKFDFPGITFEVRYFIVNLTEDGSVESVDMENIAVVDEEQAADYAVKVNELDKERGFVEQFRYRKAVKDDKEVIVFVDLGKNIMTLESSILMNGIISLIGFLVVFSLIFIYSKRIIRPVAESYEKQKQFISIAGHELRTPITIIDADAEVLGLEFEEENEWLEDIRKQTGRMSELTNELLTLSRMDEKRQQYQMIDFPFSDVVEEAAASFEILAANHSHHIETDIEPMLTYCGDEKTLRQVVGILLDNAIKYCTDEGYIKLKLEKKSHHVVLAVTNSCAPVTEEQLKHFFERFYRTDESRNSEKGGYGLGLAIAKSVVETHHGKISAASAENGEVVVVTVSLPVK